jgi:hypothetical protein
MQPKAVLSFVGRLVGIAVLASPLAAQAAEPPSTPQSSPSVHRTSPSHAGERKEERTKKGAKRGPHHRVREHEAAPTPQAGPPPEVTTERVSTKSPPKPSSTPLPTLAAATTKPLVEPIPTKGTGDFEIKAHAVEPRRTPIVHVSLRPESASTRIDRRTRHAKPPCLHAPVAVVRGTEEASFPLTKCDGSAAPLAVEEMSILVRPGSAAKPTAPTGEIAAKAARGNLEELAPGIKKIDERLLERMQLVVDHFAKVGEGPKLFVVSGYRPSSKGSFHAMGRAIDFRIEGVENTDLVAFCKTLPDTGCGFYPNSSFIHIDVRDPGNGHVSWIDASGPGDRPDYVAAWPPTPKEDGDDPVKLLAKLDELQLLPPPGHDGHDDGEGDKASKPEPAALTKKLDDEK